MMTKPVSRMLTAVLAALAFLSVFPALAQTTDNPVLDGLFDDLKQAPNELAAAEISRRIWQEWLSPDDTGLAELMQQAGTARAIGNFPRAFDLVDTIIEQYPDYSEGWNFRATINYETGRYEESLDDIAETLAREPRHFGALSGKALVYLALGKEGLARLAVEDALKVHPFIAEHPPLSDLVEPKVRI